MTDFSDIDGIGIDGLSDDADGRVLAAMVEVLSSAQRSAGVPILSCRYHSFLRAPEGIFLNLHSHKLTPFKIVSKPYGENGETPIYEVAVCRHCGQAYILGSECADNKAKLAWLNPKHEDTNADDDFLPRKYYRVLSDKDDADPAETVEWLCPICGSLHNEQNGGLHRFKHEQTKRTPIALNEVEAKQADEVVARCRHCGFQSTVAIQPMRVSPEAAGSVVCYELVREVPPFKTDEAPSEDDLFGPISKEKNGGSVICFSDKRQDAAFFAPAMERTYSSITRRQLIREAVEDTCDDDGCSPDKAANLIASIVAKRYPELLGPDAKDQATAWLLDELAAEDSRNSLEGLGVIRIEPTAFNEGFATPQVEKVVQKELAKLRGDYPWLSSRDFALLAKVCLESLRERNVINVPEGIDQLRNNHERRGNFVIQGDDGTDSQGDTVKYVGTATGATENKRSSFIRKYALKVHGVTLSRADSQRILQELFIFTAQYIFFLNKRYLVGTRDRFMLDRNLWKLYPHHDNDIVFRCDVCGCETHLDTNGVCTTSKCQGTMRAMTFAEAKNKDRFYKNIYQEEALPLVIEEHTAQLSSKKARETQSKFIKGDVNVLSCTTTFELGVDVGDLRAIFMRNVPPSTANYTQRAGRVGRRAGMPGYAVTFARLRPHDIAHFNNPERIISGSTRVPVCYLDNDAIAIRHVFAIAMSEFFRMELDRGKKDYSHRYNDFMDLSSNEPAGLVELREYLESKPQKVFDQISQVIPRGISVSKILDIEGWSWTRQLVAPQNGSESGGRLTRAHALKHADYDRIEQGININRQENGLKAASLMRTQEALKKEQTISVLAENGILPKYGFPTDLVELHLPEICGSSSDSRLSLARGMRQAIREYAPGSEVVAGKTLWRSIAIRKPKGYELERRRFGECPECKAFVWPIDNYDSKVVCPVCKTEFELEKSMLIPSFGFEGMKVRKGVGLHKPRSKGFSRVYFSQHWPTEASVDTISFAGGDVHTRYAGNGQLCVLNTPRAGFGVCSRCGASATGNEKIPHWEWCNRYGGEPHISHYDALGAAFVSDVLELVFDLYSPIHIETAEWESVMWALFNASAQLLEIPETELGGTIYRNEMQGFSVMIYDDVPGGAGHAKQLSHKVRDLIETAYSVVDGHCGCSDDTCCYGCIANYYNQSSQSKLSRGVAKQILGSLLGCDE